MAFTYSGDPANSDLETVRFLIGDTVSTDVLLQDAEINYLLTVEPNVYKAAVTACKTIAATFARKADRAVGDLFVKFSKKYDQYIALSQQLEIRAKRETAGIYAGGISRADKKTQDQDTDRVKPAFHKDQWDNPRGGIQGNPRDKWCE